ncbi:MAG: SgcJ/EcaC family oxidoreductase [Deltaproteobacteria bacterium]|nr:SgcJ/EcaC family oxidoreductase [Deltaproteobacteria bacterium]
MKADRFYIGWKFGLISAGLVVLMHFFLSPPWGETASPTKRRGAKADDQTAAGKTVETLVAAWNKSDHETVAKLFLPDAVLILPTGSVLRSRSAIRKRIIEERQGRLKESTLRNAVDKISLVDARTAIVKGKYRLDGMRLVGLKTSTEGAYIFRQRKHQGQWLISKAEILRNEKK